MLDKTKEEANYEGFKILVSGVKDYAIFMLDKTGHIMGWNEGAERINGYKANEVIGKHFSIFYTEEDKVDEKPARELRIASATGKYEEEGLRVRKDGSTYWANVVITALFDSKGELYGFGKVTRDITERKANEKQILDLNANLERKVQERTATLEKQTAQLKRSNEELERFAYISSHDLKEPLRMVVNFTQLLQARYNEKLDEEGREYVKFAYSGAVRMYQLIGDLLAYSQLGKTKATFQKISVHNILDEVKANLQLLLKETKTEIIIDRLPEIEGDRWQILQLLQNLITNAIKFRKNNQVPIIQIGCEEKEVEWLFSVKDNGLGIDPSYHQKIFTIFQRLHRREEYPGTGIGLAICKKIALHHGGKIWVESKVGEGSTFYFTLSKKPLETERLDENDSFEDCGKRGEVSG